MGEVRRQRRGEKAAALVLFTCSRAIAASARILYDSLTALTRFHMGSSSASNRVSGVGAGALAEPMSSSHDEGEIGRVEEARVVGLGPVVPGVEATS